LAPPPVPARASVRPSKLYRDEVVRWVDRGFGHFLQMVEVEPRIFDGKFTGWTIVGLYPRNFWQDIDLREGDVVTRINGLPIERETEAFSAFQGLKQAKQLTVSFEREGKPKVLQFPIVERGRASTSIASR
jgi:type II secretory pathway component PulC